MVDYFKQEGLSLNLNDFSKMLEGTRAAAVERDMDKTPKAKGKGKNASPVARAVAGNALFSKQESFLFNALLNQAAKLPDSEAAGVRKELLARLSVSLGSEAVMMARKEAMSGYMKDIEEEERRKRLELEQEAARKREQLESSFNDILKGIVELTEEEESEEDLLERMKEVITANEAVNHSDLERLITLKGKGNQIASQLVEAFETSPEKPEGAK